jgi:tetratricopeptide (TPR) repeat protein
MIMSMTLSRINPMFGCLIGLLLWLIVACAAPAPEALVPPSGNSARLYTRTPTPTGTPIPTLHPQVVYQQGLAQRDRWDLELALDRFDAALLITPSAAVYASRAEVYRLMGRYEAAASDIESALVLEPELAKAWWQKALLNRAQERWDEALEATDKLIELQPRDGAAYVLRAQINSKGFNRFKQALDDYGRASEIDSVLDEATQVARWQILAKLEDWDDALRISGKMIVTGNQDPLRYFYLGWSLLQVDRVDDAIRALFLAIRWHPDYPLAHYYALGVAYYERQAWLEAIQALEVALIQLGAPSSENVPLAAPDITSADILGRMGVSYLELKQCETGAAMVERAVDESIDHTTWEWAVGRIEECYISLTPTPTPEDVPAP